MIIELKGVEFDNKGSALMLASIVDAFKTHMPHVKFALAANRKSTADQRASVATYRKVSLRKLYCDGNRLTYLFPAMLSQGLQRLGIVTEGQVAAIIDASGFAYSDQWSPYMSVLHLAGEIERCHRAGKPYIFLPQAFGPFGDPRCRKLLARALPKAALICARDAQSYAYLHDITGDLPHLVMAKDFTNSLKPQPYVWPKAWAESSQSPKACLIVNSNMTTPKNKDKGWLARYHSMLLHSVEVYRAKGYIPFFLNHEGAGDAAMIQALNAQLSTPLPVLAPDDALTVKQIIASSDTVLSSRFHGCVSALSSGIPCLGTSWSHKYEALYDDYQVTECLLSPALSDKDLEAIIEQSLAKELKIHVTQRAQQLLVETDALWQKVFALIANQTNHQAKIESLS